MTAKPPIASSSGVGFLLLISSVNHDPEISLINAFFPSSLSNGVMFTVSNLFVFNDN